jgi:hypothetical protein
MAKQRFSHSDRRAFWEAYEHRCAYCDEALRWMDLVIDHIIPESLLDKPQELALVRSEYGLSDLDLLSDLNLVPACGRCNRQKSDRLYPPERTMIILGKASQRASRVAVLRACFQQEPRADKLLAGVSIAIETGALSRAELQQFFDVQAGDEYSSGDEPMRGREVKSAVSEDPDILRIFGNASCGLLGWPTEVSGHWIERQELGKIRALLEGESHSFTALLGSPGSGKSAVLARLGSELAERGVALLALKADLIPGCVDTLARLEDYLGLPGSLAECVRQLAATRVVVLLIDQVDALTELMDRNPARLAVLLGLIHRLRGIDNIHVVLSCRDFEFHHDLRLASLKPHPVQLSDLAWEDVRHVLMDIGIEARNWPPEVRRLLSRPQHLNLFVTHLAAGSDVPVFRSYHSMLEAVLRERVLRQPWGALAMRTLELLAGSMATEEELWLPVARFSEQQAELDRLVAADLLAYSSDELRIGFRHQTLFDFLRARAFTARCVHLSEYVLERQNALFVRPTLWSTLHYLREADRDGYHREVRALWFRAELRNHIRYLLISFLGQVPDPDPVEGDWLFPLLPDARLRWKVIQAVEGNPAWFAKLQARLPELMSGDEQAAWHASWLLRQAFNFDRDSVLGLIEEHWLPSSDRDRLIVETLCALTQWDERAVRVAVIAVRRTADQDGVGRGIVSLVAKSRPDLAPRILAAELWGSLECAERAPAPVPPPPPGDAPDSERISYELIHGDAPSRAVEAIVSDASRWHDVGGVADAAPQVFVEQVWPWLLHVLRRYCRDRSTRFDHYTRDSIFDLPGDQRRHLHMDLAAAIEKAICGFACASPNDFLTFVDRQATSEMLVVHRLLARGMRLIATEHAVQVVQYLLGDTRRFALGDYRDEHAETRALITAAVRNVDLTTRLLLEQAIRRWEYTRPVQGEVADDRRHRLRWNRQHRIRLLRAFPLRHLSPEGAKLLREEERALPGTPDRERDIEGGIMSSPVSAEQMAKASDADLLNLLDELHDGTGWHHPRDFLKGGSLEASRAFGEFAKAHQKRALKLTRRLQPGRHERYAAEALRGISENEQPDLGPLIQTVHELAARGFGSEEFQHAAAWALAKVSPKNTGLDDPTCILLEGWLRHAKEEVSEVTRSNGADTDRIRSILMEGGIEILPGGNYPVLHALFMGCFYRKQTDLDRWLSVLKKHLGRVEDPRVWEALCQREFTYLDHAPSDRANELVERLIEKAPRTVYTEGFVRFIGRAHRWLRPSLTESCMQKWLGGAWDKGPQAAAEVAMLRHALIPDDSRSREVIDTILTAEGSGDDALRRQRCGVAFLCGELWDVPRARPVVTRVLMSLLPFMESSLADGWLSVFNRSERLLADSYTEQLLDAIIKHPVVLRYGYTGALVDRVKEMLGQGSEEERVCRVVTKLLSERGEEAGDIRKALAISAGDLVEIALTLQRSPQTRSPGTDIFERLMDLNVYQAAEALGELDRRFPR